MSKALVWFRQDLRLKDNPAFVEACNQNKHILLLYVFDKTNNLLGKAQAWWLHHSLMALQKSLKPLGLELILRQGNPLEILFDLVKKQGISSVYWNRCYEPSAITRDKTIKASLLEEGIEVQSYNGSLLNEPWSIRNQNGEYFKVFTPYWKTCRQGLSSQPEKKPTHIPLSLQEVSEDLNSWQLLPTPNWASEFPKVWTPGEEGAKQGLTRFMTQQLEGYKLNRDFPAKNATSRLSPHLHFGEISPWAIVRAVELAKLEPDCDLAAAESFLFELGWREFSYSLLYHLPALPCKNVKKQWDSYTWENPKHLLKHWQQGMTGYPIIDAGMRELWTTGYMHNRVRMIVASFLTKDLLVDWRLGASWFLDTLVDADLANNSASWQWVAGTGVDAAPYFRIFNPLLQSKKFDPDGTYIRKWVPELASLKKDTLHAPWMATDATKIYETTKYPRPIINHDEARARALKRYHQLLADRKH